MLKCRDVAHLGSDYVDHHLSLRARLALALHLLLCGKCRAFIRQLRIALATYPGLRPAALPEPEARALAMETVRKAAEDHGG